jgi:hypothetical protein
MDDFLKALRSQLPGIRSQGQMVAFMASFDAFRATLEGITEGNQIKEDKAKLLLLESFEVFRAATAITELLESVPEAAVSSEAKSFKRPPEDV